jgi:hypothetical protein
MVTTPTLEMTVRARSTGGVIAALVAILLVPAAAAAQSDVSLVADNPDVRCDAPLPSIIVTGELGSTLWVQDPSDIDKVTLITALGAEILDVDWEENRREATIDVSADVTSYAVWSCAPLNGEPFLANDPQQV